MPNKKYIEKFRLSYLGFKRLGFAYFIPPIILFFYIPVTSYSYILAFGYSDTAFFHIFLLLQKSIPITSCIWILFVLSDYTQSNISELFYMHRKFACLDFLILFIWYLLHVVLVFLGLSIFVYNYFPHFSVIFIQMLMFSSGSFFLLFLTKSMFLPFFLSLIYQLFVLAFTLESTAFISMLYVHFPSQNILGDFLAYLPMLIISLVLIFLGEVFYRLRR